MESAWRETAQSPLRSLSDLPPEIVSEIFGRLPPKDFIRCGAVCKVWRRLTSDRSVQLQNHRRQRSNYMVIFTREAGFVDLAVADYGIETLDLAGSNLRSIVRFVDTFVPEADAEAEAIGNPLVVHGSVQGVLLLSHYEELCLCNPTTRRWTPLDPVHLHATMMGLYIHPVLKEFRVLFCRDKAEGNTCSYFVLEVASGSVRMVCQQERAVQLDPAPICLSGRFYWLLVPISPGVVTVFDTVSEMLGSFATPTYDENKRLLRHRLLDLDGQLAISIAWREAAQEDLEGPSFVDLWLREEESWTLKRRVQLPVASILQFVEDDVYSYWTAILVSEQDGVIVETESHIIHYNDEGNLKLVLSTERDVLEMSPFMLQESVVSYPYLRLNNPPAPPLQFFGWL